MNIPPRPFKLSVIACAICYANLTYAQDAQVQALQTIQVKASNAEQSSEQTKAYNVKNSSSATKLNIEAKETPQTINVVTRQQIEDFGLTSTRDVLRNTPGVTVSNQETERTTYMARGFEISNILTDGVGFPLSGYNYNNTNPDTYFYDRVEVVKGADSLTNAFGDPSATINNIRKRPTQEFQASGGVSYGSWDTQRYEADVSGSILPSGKVRGRIMGYEQTGDSYLDRYSAEKNGFAGIVEADLTDSTLLTAGYSQEQNKPNANNWGALPLLDANGKQISYDRSYNPNPDWAHWDNETKNAFVELKQKLNDQWNAKLTYNYLDTKHNSRLLYYYGYPKADGSGVSLTPWGGQEHQEKHAVDFNLEGTYKLFNREHEATLGYSYIRNHQQDKQSTGTINDSNVIKSTTTDWTSWTPQSITWSDFTEAANYKQNINSIYAATRLHLNEDLKLLLGANYVQAESKGESYSSPMTYSESKVSPYVGLTYNFTPEYTGYMSYTSIFRPQTGIDKDTNQALKPIEGKSYEMGVKSSWLDDRLTGTLSVFKTEQNNYPLRNSDGNPLNRKVPTSDLESQGVEVGLSGQITDNVNLSFGYAQFSIKDTKNGGEARTYNPNQTLNLLTTYTPPVLPKLKVGAGLQWQDGIKLYDSNVNGTIKQDAYALVNLMASYEVNDHITLQANGNNIFDKKYLNSFPDGQAFYGAPANYTVAVKFKY
ncbi:TonB-dependent siderophore receptor [Acinetobacter baumannii]|jgi:outer membrane receptor for ferric coprogen and ferric-rhodotorulic acid|uniref:TonB-dependent siderophore receptor n=1 Tax=Acinetobacter TaxID=469 RepID=UPI0007073BBC|nr:TonB-dependent siderophore receptor [Acinetobacter baumannii]EHU1306388.1 TonB-dependent siderophore receptor [Acinetobacter baumannii]EHU1427218.1 TonB-dependent siderophore receptor [Acinetobacter baumannii]EHU2157900.1 TonB-dependent siderophore receptor [Acinetobacter baumannii]EHU2440079.1 TonB-dependent siderophore receptor [Acinetobacter baumannii]EIB6849200.1 TonB-dependent siderophore receptor [Acinetobacter baumannii]